MKNLKLVASLFMLFAIISVTQAQTWCFGSGVGLNFSGNTVSVAEGSA
ncbi:MAG: hypothetical protein HQ471_03130 [Flavobacteriales bacterium]|jgi:hypothetical protein|nr:hypothetical protein [Flavobacteriales bacterium]